MSTITLRARHSSANGIDEAAELFRLMGDPTRLAILLNCVDGSKNVGEIAAALDVSGSLVSHHLRLLRAARLVRAERRGRQIFYSPLDERVQCIIDDVVAHVIDSRHAQDAG